MSKWSISLSAETIQAVTTVWCNGSSTTYSTNSEVVTWPVSVLMSVYNGETYLREAMRVSLNKPLGTWVRHCGWWLKDSMADWHCMLGRISIVLIRNEQNIGLEHLWTRGWCWHEGSTSPVRMMTYHYQPAASDPLSIPIRKLVH